MWTVTVLPANTLTSSYPTFLDEQQRGVRGKDRCNLMKSQIKLAQYSEWSWACTTVGW